MKVCAIDVHHHYVPNSLLEEAKKNGKHLGVEFAEKGGQKSLSFAGGPPFVLHPELPAIDERLKMMSDSKLAMAALEAHTATLGYRLTGEQGENWCNVYNEGINELVKRDRKSTRLNSSHGYISYAVFCLKKKKKNEYNINVVVEYHRK